MLPIPTDGRPADYRGAVGHYQIISRATPNQVKAGDPITLHLAIQGDGPMDLVQAPPLSRLSELTSNFKVENDPLAGIVQDDIKLFTVSIRPRREGITHVPAIPFSFFEPRTEKFVTVHSQPIPIRVDAADQLAMDAIVGRSASFPAASRKDTVAGPMLSLDNFAGAQLLVSLKPASWSLVGLGVLLPPLAFVMMWAFRHREQFKAFRMVTRGHELKSALGGVDAARSPWAIAHALREFVMHRQNAGRSQTSSTNMVHDIEPEVSPDTAFAFDGIVQKCEQASYAGLESLDLAGLAQEAKDCLRRLDAELPSTVVGQPEQEDSSRPLRRTKEMFSRVALLFVCGAMLFAGDSKASATELSASQQSQILTEAAAAYRQAQGVAKTDAAESKALFTRAAQKYQTLVDAGVVNDQLYFNLGNAHLQSGSLGYAIANYEQAIAINPSSIANRNLKHARSLLPWNQTTAVEVSTSRLRKMVNSILEWNARLSRTRIAAIAMVSWVFVWGAAIAVLLHRSPLWRRLVSPAAMIAIMCALSLGLQSCGRSSHEKAIVVVPQAQLREGNGDAFALLDTLVTEGTSCDMLEQRGDWLKVTTHGTTGWLPRGEAVCIRPT